MNMLMNSVSDTTDAPTIASSWARSPSGEVKSFSRNCRRNSRVRMAYEPLRDGSISRTQGRKIRQVARQRFRIVANHQLREHCFERRAGRQLPQPRDRIVGHHHALVQDDDAIADALDDLENVRAVEDRLAARGQ